MNTRSSSQAIGVLPSEHRRATAATSDPKLRAAKGACREKIRFICGTRYSAEDFFKSSALGRCLPLYRNFPKDQRIELRLFQNNQEGLATVYNIAIEEEANDPAVLVFIHDDVFFNDCYWSQHLHDALESFDVVGIAGNIRRVPGQASWMYLNDAFVSDSHDNLSGVIVHGEGFPNLRQLSIYGEPGQQCKLLDGVFLAVGSQVLTSRNLRPHSHQYWRARKPVVAGCLPRISCKVRKHFR